MTLLGADLNEILKRLNYLEREIAELKQEKSGVKAPPLIDPGFVREVLGAASAQCKHDKITEALLEGMEQYGQSGISAQAATYQDPESGKRIWYTNTISVKELLEFPLEEVIEVLSPLANLHRLRILSMLIKGNRSTSEIGTELKMEGGQLYHHLDYLLNARYIKKVDRGLYSIDLDGWRALFTVAQLGWYMKVKAPELKKLLDEKTKLKTCNPINSKYHCQRSVKQQTSKVQ